jgi:hypothetical protein
MKRDGRKRRERGVDLMQSDANDFFSTGGKTTWKVTDG